jgi:dTDP-4-amino-4,6-dideoxygalactose transaminase
MTPAAVPFLDLRLQYRSIQAEIEAALRPVLEAQALILGPEVEALERELSASTGVSQAIAVASGTDALYLALRALRIGPGDEVLTSAYSFFATAGAILQVGARPRFADIQLADFNVDPEAAAAAISPSTRALMPVHLFGQCASMDPLEALARQAGIPIVEDAAQAIGARFGERTAGSIGALGCLSFYPTKNLGGLGDGGMVLTSDAQLASLLRALRNHGQTGPYEHRHLGCNSRLDALNAAALRVKLRHLARWTEERRARAARYRQLFGDAGLLGQAVTLPGELPGRYHVYNQFVIRIPDRDALRRSLESQGIGSMVYYPRPLPAQPVLVDLGYRADAFPRAVEAARTSLALPLYPELSGEQQQRVVSAIARHYGISGA